VHTVVCCSEIQDPEWRWIEPVLPAPNAAFEFVSCPKVRNYGGFNVARMIASWRAVWLARRVNASVIVTHGPTLAMWCCIFAFLLRLKGMQIFAHSFNFTALPGRMKSLIFSLALRRAERFAVFSRMERDLYARAFKLDPDKFDFVHWGVRPPQIKGEPIVAGNYVSSIGGNARDYRTLMEAARLMRDTNFVVIARPQNLEDLDVPENVAIRTNLPWDDAMNILGHSRLLVLPLVGSEVPCGHVTIVAAMHLGKPVVITDSTGVADYIEDGVTGLTVKMGSPSELKIAVDKLMKNETLLNSLADNGRHFAVAYCSERAIARHFSTWLESR
jgi:glycosyltransferase involved in cell wall biosynthesis